MISLLGCGSAELSFELLWPFARTVEYADNLYDMSTYPVRKNVWGAWNNQLASS